MRVDTLLEMPWVDSVEFLKGSILHHSGIWTLGYVEASAGLTVFGRTLGQNVGGTED